MHRFIIALICMAIPFGAAAQAYRAENQLLVVPLGKTEFEVIEARGEGPRGIWCAAAGYAQVHLGTAEGARIYIKKGRGPSISGVGRKSIVFTTDEAALGTPALRSYSLSVRQVGLGLPSGHARQFCLDYLMERLDRFR